MSRPASSRRITLTDIMIFIAVSAPGLGVVRASIPNVMDLAAFPRRNLTPWDEFGWYCLAMLSAVLLAAFWSPALCRYCFGLEVPVS